MTSRLGRADLHIHTLASDGIDPLATILDHVERSTELDVVAITDHERIDAALAARTMARELGHRAEIVVGEEVSTLGGHLLALFIGERVRPLRSLRTTIGEIHEQGGLAIPAHPLVPYPLCAQGWVLRRLLADRDARVQPDAIEAFNPTMFGRPWHGRVVRFAEQHGLATVGSSDSHEATTIGSGWTSFPGRTADDLRAAIVEGRTHHHGAFHATGGQVSTFGRQLRKYSRDARDVVGGKVRRDGTGRDLGYPGGRHRPPRFEEEWMARRAAPADEAQNRGR
ncbi:MAG TPA: PHP-associated domain-containing protein [Candidatus Deferrimicrobium sp.]|nr:PHP-associated domain-containing protein [Candidatus Deferrimicrobium sp.]